MKSAVQAMIITTLAFCASMIVGDALISAISIIVSVFKVAQAADVQMRRRRGPVCVRPYRYQWMR